MQRKNSYFTVLTIHITIWRKRWANFWQKKYLRLSILNTALGTDINCSCEVQTYHFWIRDIMCSSLCSTPTPAASEWAPGMSPQQKTGSGKLLQTFMTINLLGYSLVLDYINRLRRTAEIRKMIYFYPSTVQQHWSCGLMHVQEHIKANQRRFSSLPSQ